MKVIIDTNIYISAFAFDREVLKLCNFCLENVEVYTSISVMAELRSKFLGGRLEKICKNFEIDRAKRFLDTVDRKSHLVWVTEEVKVVRDSTDNKFLELAKTVEANYLITGDKDLLGLERFENTRIVRPGECLGD